MATLRAHGEELARVKKQGKTNGGSDYTVEQVLMSDSTVLQKHTFVHDGVRHSAGYKKFCMTARGREDWLAMKLEHEWKQV